MKTIGRTEAEQKARFFYLLKNAPGGKLFKIKKVKDFMSGNYIIVKVLDENDEKPFENVKTGEKYSFSQMDNMKTPWYVQGEKEDFWKVHNIIDKSFDLKQKEVVKPEET